MKHITIINREDKGRLPLAAAPCSTFNICFFGDWDECSGSTDWCMKDGARPADDVNQ